jgi:D-3-phosphoglycerate dehydrogenase/(S)-sulfolactate dehydrogenase
VVVLSRVGRYAVREVTALARSGFDSVDRTQFGDIATEDQLISLLDGAWGVVAGGERYSRRVIASLPQLKLIARTGIGFDAVDVAAATDAGVAVVVTPGANSESVADFTLALILACMRSTMSADAAVRSGEWRLDAPGRDLFQATVGIVGVGRIGQALARRLRAFECRILAVESRPDTVILERPGIELFELDAMLPQVDVLSLHVPLTEETHHIISAQQLRALPRHAVVVNTSRGPVIDQAALVAALKHGTIAAAGLDVFENEPLATGDVLTTLPNVVLAGHISSFTHEAMSRMMAAVSTSCLEMSKGRVPPGCVNPEVLGGTRAGSGAT